MHPEFYCMFSLMADMFEEARHVIEDDIRAGRYAAT